MITIGTKALNLKINDEVLVDNKGPQLITDIAINGIFVNLTLNYVGSNKRSWYYLDDIVNKVINK